MRYRHASFPAEPLVWQPLNEMDQYGANRRHAFTGSGTVRTASTQRVSGDAEHIRGDLALRGVQQPTLQLPAGVRVVRR